MTNRADLDWGGKLCMISVEPDPRLDQLRQLDEWLTRLTVWQHYLLISPFALITAGLTVWLNSAVPLVDPKLFPDEALQSLKRGSA
jgi:hypothetical protein